MGAPLAALNERYFGFQLSRALASWTSPASTAARRQRAKKLMAYSQRISEARASYTHSDPEVGIHEQQQEMDGDQLVKMAIRGNSSNR